MATLDLQGVSKVFGATVALEELSLSIGSGELVSLLGPSGCGKTTALRIVAGFEAPTTGELLVDGEDFVGVPASKRNMGMVFQAYSLFPNMTARQNVEFGMRMRKIARDKCRKRAEELLGLVGLAERVSNYPHELSGGQQQRVALARALAIEPAILLLDEPLSALDAKVRVELRQQIREVQTRLGITTLYVTHDQEEALSISDRIAVMSQGKLEQVGAPADIYRSPRTEFVANFVGLMNGFDGRLQSNDTVLVGAARASDRPQRGRRCHGWRQVLVLIRPESVGSRSWPPGDRARGCHRGQGAHAHLPGLGHPRQPRVRPRQLVADVPSLRALTMPPDTRVRVRVDPGRRATARALIRGLPAHTSGTASTVVGGRPRPAPARRGDGITELAALKHQTSDVIVTRRRRGAPSSPTPLASAEVRPFMTDLFDLEALRRRLATAPEAARLERLGLQTVVLGDDALAALPRIVTELVATRGLRGPVAILSDTTPKRYRATDLLGFVTEILAARSAVRSVTLGAAGHLVHADEETLAGALSDCEGAACLVAVGSGTVADIGKVVAAAQGMGYVVVHRQQRQRLCRRSLRAAHRRREAHHVDHLGRRAGGRHGRPRRGSGRDERLRLRRPDRHLHGACRLVPGDAARHGRDLFADGRRAGSRAGTRPGSASLTPRPNPGGMQQVAAELNHSETAFLHPGSPGSGTCAGLPRQRRWNSAVTRRLPLHLCSGKLRECPRVRPYRLRRFQGRLSPGRTGTGSPLIFLPSGPCYPTGPGLNRALGATPVFTGKNRFDLLVELPAASDVCDCEPDMAALAGIPARGIIVTAASDLPDFDFVSRFFAPAVGITEDPVTGSAHCCLGRTGRNSTRPGSPGSSVLYGAGRSGSRSKATGCTSAGTRCMSSRDNCWCDRRAAGAPRVILSWLTVTYLTGDKRLECILSEKHS